MAIRARVVLKPRAERELADLPTEARDRIVAALAASERGDETDARKLAGQRRQYRLRVGRYRVLFELQEGVATVYRVADRKDAYD